MREVQNKSFIRPAKAGEPWKPGNTLILWTNGTYGFDWPQTIMGRQDGTEYVFTYSSVRYLLETPEPWLMISIGPPAKGRDYHYDYLPHDIEGLKVWPLGATMMPQKMFWRKYRTGPTRNCIHAISLTKPLQLETRDKLGITLTECALPSAIKNVGPDTYQWWVHL